MQPKIRTIVIKAICFALLLSVMLMLVGYATLPARSFTRLLFHEFYQEKQPIDIAFVGTSRFYRGINPQVIDSEMNVTSFNFGTSQQRLVDSYYILEELYKTQSPEVVVLGVTWQRLYEPKSAMPSNLVFNYLKPSLSKLNYFFDAYDIESMPAAIFPGLQNVDANWIGNMRLKRTPEYRNYDYAIAAQKDADYAGKGHVATHRGFEDGRVGDVSSATTWDMEKVNPDSLRWLERGIKLCLEKGSKVICISTPMPASAMAYLGDYTECLRYMDDLLSEYGLTLYDFALAKPELFDAKDRYFYDGNHLNGEGAVAFSTALARFIEDCERGDIDKSALFYDSFEQMLQAAPRVRDVQLSYDEENMRVTATAFTGVDAPVVFDFSYKLEGDSDYADYGEGAQMDVSGLAPGRYTVRADAHIEGSANPSEQWESLDIQIAG